MNPITTGSCERQGTTRLAEKETAVGGLVFEFYRESALIMIAQVVGRQVFVNKGSETLVCFVDRWRDSRSAFATRGLIGYVKISIA